MMIYLQMRHPASASTAKIFHLENPEKLNFSINTIVMHSRSNFNRTEFLVLPFARMRSVIMQKSPQ